MLEDCRHIIIVLSEHLLSHESPEAAVARLRATHPQATLRVVCDAPETMQREASGDRVAFAGWGAPAH